VDTYKQYGEIESIDYLTGYYDCLVPNVSTGLFSDVRIRQAVAYALDKRDIISTALLGHAVATDYPVLPDSFLAGEGASIYEYNLQKATSLLEEAGWKDRDEDGIAESVDGSNISELSVQLLVPAEEDDPYRRDVAVNIATQLADCGINVTVDEVDPTVYVNRLQSGQFQIALCSFYLDVNPDISFMVGTDGAKNHGGFSDTTLDGLLQDCKTALKEETMRDAYIAMESRFIETVPQISLYYRTNTLIYKTAINISTELFDMNIFPTIPSWYMYTEDTLPEDMDNITADNDEMAADTPEE
jgi:ABC-type transport system substrate-binding protein